LECPCFNSDRQRWLKEPITLLRDELDQGLGTLTIEHSTKELTYRLLGGFLDDGTRQGPTVNTQSETSVLSLWAKGWGAYEEFKCPGFSIHGYVPVAKFLAAVMPKHKALLFPTGKRIRDALTYDTSSGEDSPIKVPREKAPSCGSIDSEGFAKDDMEGRDWPVTPNNQAEVLRNMARLMGTHAVLQFTTPEGGDSEMNLSDNPGYDSPLLRKAREKLRGVF